MSVVQRSFARDRQRYPSAVGCLMWWGLFAASFAGYMLFFFGMSAYKAELGPGQVCDCVDINTVAPIVLFGILFVSQLYMIYLVESRKKKSSLGQSFGMLVISMLFLPIFGTVVGIYLLARMARDPQVHAFYSPESNEGQ